MRIISIISLVIAAVGCSLYVTPDEQTLHGGHRPDAGTCCQSDASVGISDGGLPPPDGCLRPDGGSCLDPDGGTVQPDGGTASADGGATGVDGAIDYPDARHR